MTLDNLSNVVAPRAVLTLPIANIAVPAARIGFYCEDHAARLGADIAANGQNVPIGVKKNGNAAKLGWQLVYGLHRLRGVELLGGTSIDAIQVADAGTSADELRRLELSENLDHRQRRPIERAIFMVERARMEEAIDHPGRVGETKQERAARVRWDAKDTMSHASNWQERTAAAMGCGVRQLRRYEQIHRNIVEALPDLAERLNFHPLGDSFSAMERVAGLNEIARPKTVEIILSRPDWKSIDEALVAAGVSADKGFRVDQDRADAVILDAWLKLKPVGKRAHVEWLAEKVTPTLALAMIARFKARGLLS